MGQGMGFLSFLTGGKNKKNGEDKGRTFEEQRGQANDASNRDQNLQNRFLREQQSRRNLADSNRGSSTFDDDHHQDNIRQQQQDDQRQRDQDIQQEQIRQQDRW